MAQQIKLKRSAVSGKVPTTAQLQSGEIAINTADGKLFFKRDDTTIQSIITTNTLITGSLELTGTGSFGRVEATSIDLDRLSLTSTQTTVPPLQLTANSLQDGVGALRIDGSQADIFLNPSTATHTTVTFAVNNDQRIAFGMDNSSDFYITRRTGGTWYDNTFVLSRDTGELSLGYGLVVTSSITGSDTYIDDWGSVSASLASIETGTAALSLDDVTSVGSSTTNDISVGTVTIDSYSTIESGKVTVNNGVLGVIGGTYSGTTYAGLVMDYVLYNSGRTNQRTGTLLVTANSSEAVYSETVTTDIGSTDGAEITVTIGSGNFRANLDNNTGSTMYVTYNIKLLKV